MVNSPVPAKSAPIATWQTRHPDPDTGPYLITIELGMIYSPAVRLDAVSVHVETTDEAISSMVWRKIPVPTLVQRAIAATVEARREQFDAEMQRAETPLPHVTVGAGLVVTVDDETPQSLIDARRGHLAALGRAWYIDEDPPRPRGGRPHTAGKRKYAEAVKIAKIYNEAVTNNDRAPRDAVVMTYRDPDGNKVSPSTAYRRIRDAREYGLIPGPATR